MEYQGKDELLERIKLCTDDLPEQKGFEEGEDFLRSGNSRLISITEAARINNVTRQAIYVAIQQGKLKAVKQMNRWFIREDDLAVYTSSKYSRSKSTAPDGTLIFSESRFSPKSVAKILKVPVQQVYYAIRTGQLPVIRTGKKGVTCVVREDDLRKYKEVIDAKKRARLQRVDNLQHIEENASLM